MGAVRLLRTLAPLTLVAGLLAACGNGSSSDSGGQSNVGDSTILGASPGFEVRTVYARYAPGVPFGPQLSQALIHEMSSQSCPMRPRIAQDMLMECDTGKTVYLLRNPIVEGDVATATPLQIGHKNIWYVEVKLSSDVSRKLDSQLASMTGEQLAFSYAGQVLTSIAIDSSFHPEHFAITGDYDKAQATKLAQELTA
jgi:preprotein translocase subunit SecD